MNQILVYQPNMIADVVYNIVLYSALLCTALPFFYVMAWKLIGFWRTHGFLFYFTAVAIFGGTFAAFYATRNDWLLYYEPFPYYLQVTGLALYCLSFILIRLSHHHLNLKTVLFYSPLSGRHGSLVTGGIYRIVRHPVYALIPLFVAGSFLYTGEFILVLPFALNLLLRWYYARLEDKYLFSVYGDQYAAYKTATPNRFYPVFLRARSK